MTTFVDTSGLIAVLDGDDAGHARAARAWGDLLNADEVVRVEAEVHAAALGAFLAAGQRGLSLVDCTSFEVMRRGGIRRAFTLDADFLRQGFEVLPAGRAKAKGGVRVDPGLRTARTRALSWDRPP